MTIVFQALAGSGSGSDMADHGAVLLDMDGLLLDTEPLWGIAESIIAARLGWRYTDADHRALIGVDLQRTAEYLRSRAPGPCPDVPEIQASLMTVLCRVAREHGVKYKPGAAALLDSLTAWGIPRALVTSSARRFTRAVLAAKGLEFGVTVCAEDTRRHKPDPAPYQCAAWQLGQDPRDCAAVEDSPAGVASALEAGCTVYVVPSGPPADPAAHVLRSLAGLTVTADGLQAPAPRP